MLEAGKLAVLGDVTGRLARLVRARDPLELLGLNDAKPHAATLRGGAIVARVRFDPIRSHRSWFGRASERVELDGVEVYLGARNATIAFPEPGADLDGAVRLALDRGVPELGCWSYAPEEELGERLHALGFQDGWSPHWMGIDPTRAAGTGSRRRRRPSSSSRAR